MCERVYKRKKKLVKHKKQAKDFVDDLTSKVDPQNEGILPLDRFIKVGTEQVPELADLLVNSRRIVDIDQWASVFTKVGMESGSMNASTVHLFQALKSGQDPKIIYDLIEKNGYEDRHVTKISIILFLLLKDNDLLCKSLTFNSRNK